MNRKRTIVFLDKEDFSFGDIIDKPLAGAQSAFIELVKAFAALGNHVVVRNYCVHEHSEGNIDWRHIETSDIPEADLFIVNRSTSLLSLPPRGAKVLFWMHNEARYLFRANNLFQLASRYPTLVFSGLYHRSTFPLWFLFKTRLIPYGISTIFINKQGSTKAPAPKVIFTSNPLRSLDWLVDRWKKIQQEVPEAELHVFSGAATYGAWGKSVASRMNQVLEYVKANQHFGIILREPLPKNLLIEEIKTSRAMLYRGDKAETFCLAVGEVQALGIPCVVQDLGSMKERVIDGITGFVTRNDTEFEQKAILVLREDEVWLKSNKALTCNINPMVWSQVANIFLNN